MIKHSIPLASLLLLLSSCDIEPEEISPDVSVEQNNVLAMVFLTPDLENHWGFVRRAPSFKERTPSNYTINDALITVWQDGQEDNKYSYAVRDTVYFLSSDAFTVGTDKTYHLEVKSNNRTLTGTTTVPNKVTDIRVDDIRRGVVPGFFGGDEEDEEVWIFDISWQDLPNEENYYIVEVWGGFRRRVGTGYEVVGQPTSLDMDFENIARDDQGEDGRRLTISIATEGPVDIYGGAIDVRDWNFVDLFLITCDRVYARYQYLTQVGGLDSGDPFSQALTLELNLEGGLGAFTAYRIHRQRIDITRYIEALPEEED